MAGPVSPGCGGHRWRVLRNGRCPFPTLGVPFRRGRRPRRPARPNGAGCRKSPIFDGPSGRPAPTVLFGGVGAIHESPADAEWHRNIPRHCEEPQGDVAIPWYKGRPENRRDCHAAFAARNDVITGRAILESPLQNTQKIPRFRRNGGFPIQIVLSNTPSGN